MNVPEVAGVISCTLETSRETAMTATAAVLIQLRAIRLFSTERSSGHQRAMARPASTAMGGSSLGGLATLHIGLAYPQTFGALVAMSPSVWWDRRVILSTVRRTRPRPPVRVWVDMGTAEGRRALDDARLLKAALVGAGWTVGKDLRYAEYEGGTHSEPAWAERFGAVLTWLFGEAKS